jgi:RHS repeat-associated protein
MLTKPDGTAYTWDVNNRLTQVTLPGTGGTVTFKYDPPGRRIYKSSSSGTKIYLYDGEDNLLEEVDNSGNVLARYRQTRDIDAPLSELRSSTISYYQSDEALGSITSLSNSAGALANTYNYDSSGNLVASTGALANPFRYAGREFDQEAGLYFYRARYLDPSTGRFISEDPIRFGGGIDFYPYVDNSPVNDTDPLGLVAGPKNPRARTRCRPTDSCSQLRGKILLLERTISSHQGWDWTMGWPRGGVRHSQEIADFWNALARSFNIYEKNCKNKEDCDTGEGFPDPQPTPQSNPMFMPIPVNPIVPPMPMPEPMPEPIFPFPEPMFPF